ncbi:MAG: four helix bundle protein [Leptolyngbya sp. PLA3]|nr:MAG: four helix bundle protein [Cyanobacteria bacterium CYA]MCE7969343.1 four helix bundle protein [Leptolyngbya sp. PL-A3]
MIPAARAGSLLITCIYRRPPLAGAKPFRDPVAQQQGMQPTLLVYAVRASMPAGERFGVTMQMRPSAVPAPPNIAERFGRESRADMVQCPRIAHGSLSGTSAHIELATSMQMLQPSRELSELIEETGPVLQAPIHTLTTTANQ